MRLPCSHPQWPYCYHRAAAATLSCATPAGGPEAQREAGDRRDDTDGRGKERGKGTRRDKRGRGETTAGAAEGQEEGPEDQEQPKKDTDKDDTRRGMCSRNSMPIQHRLHAREHMSSS
ncbi:unnamed protein product [Prorocentrum cordatum]|uniref:Uncharacterized protein n=1 Tax=Prorocentrum cordatum TaxID=2364126 RepID=A0ABN9U8F8_9DINO|nr:unnamed protein product [Polarella glacialis]